MVEVGSSMAAADTLADYGILEGKHHLIVPMANVADSSS
jgi:hypothetical protein